MDSSQGDPKKTGEKLKAKTVCMKNMKMRKGLDMPAMKEQAEKLEYFKKTKRNITAREGEMRDVVDTNKVLTKQPAHDALQAKHINKTLIMGVEEPRKTIID